MKVSIKGMLSLVWRGLKYLLLFAVVYLLLVPFLQPWLVYAWENGPQVIVLILGIGIGFLIHRKKVPVLKYWVVLVVLAFGVTMITNGLGFVQDWQIASHTNPRMLTSVPLTVQNRLTPRSISPDLIDGDNQDNRTASGSPHIIERIADDQSTLYWQAPMLYSNVWYGKFALLRSISNVVRVNAQTMKVDLESGKNAFFWFGPDSLFTKTMFKLRHPFSRQGKPVFWEKPDGSYVYLIPCISSRWTKTVTMIPDIVAVMEVNEYGGWTNYSVEDAARFFKGATLFPLELGRRRILAYCKYHTGRLSDLINALPFGAKKNLFEISEDPAKSSQDNQAPYWQVFQGIGLKQMFELEPEGSTSFALRQTFYLDSVTGEACFYAEPEHDPNPVHGGRKAIHDITNSDWNMNWDLYKPEEPLAINLFGGKRYHLVFITKKGDNPGTSVRYVLVDARDRSGHNSKSFNKQEEVEKYIDSLNDQTLQAGTKKSE